jgi:acyl carrier protein
MHFGIRDTFDIVRNIVANNLEVDPEAIDLDFRFHHFIDILANHRQRISGSEDTLDYIELANIYVDLSEAFGVHFFAEFTDCACITIADVVSIIQSKLETFDRKCR